MQHAVTELISDMNLPAAQVMVVMVVPLHCIVGIRMLYGQRGVLLGGGIDTLQLLLKHAANHMATLEPGNN